MDHGAMEHFDVVVIGGGAAGLSLAHRLSRANAAGRAGLDGVVLEPPIGRGTAPVRTWCYWERGSGPWDAVLHARWERLSVIGPDGAAHAADAAPLAYKMLRSPDFDAYVRAGLGAEIRQRRATVTRVEDGAERAVVHAEDEHGAPLRFGARWVFDSRPLRVPPPAVTTLLQHFKGWFVRTPGDAFDPGAPVLMDLRTPQPRTGVGFGYVLPMSARTALVEYTEFTRTVLDDAAYDAALRDYTGRVLRLGDFTVTAVEKGVIPMTDARLAARTGRRVFRIGAAGGATRPSTGYTFSGIQRQTAGIVRDLCRGRTPVPPVPHRARHRAMDAVLLRALDTGRVDGARFFADLFRRNRLSDVLGFLDGPSTLGRDLRLGLRTPIPPMAATAAERAWIGLRGG